MTSLMLPCPGFMLSQGITVSGTIKLNAASIVKSHAADVLALHAVAIKTHFTAAYHAKLYNVFCYEHGRQYKFRKRYNTKIYIFIVS